MYKENRKNNAATKFKIASFFAGCGGLDLGFQQAGFDVVWANEYDKTIWATYEHNHPHTFLCKKSIIDVKSDEIPTVVGMIGGPPCQSWSLAGAMRGVKDPRGKLFYEYIRILADKQPSFFLAENVAGIVSSTHVNSFENILKKFEEIGYVTSYKLLDAKSYGVPQDRKRVIIVGYSKGLHKKFEFPQETHGVNSANGDLFKPHLKPYETLRSAIDDLPNPVPASLKNKSNSRIRIPNHEYMTGGFSTIYMSRNRRRNWNEPSFTIQAGGRHAPLHPSSTEMIKKEPDWWVFKKKDKKAYRRMSVRECARVQTFPDKFIFKYDSIADGYKMVGNAVPVELARVIALRIKSDLIPEKNNLKRSSLRKTPYSELVLASS